MSNPIREIMEIVKIGFLPITLIDILDILVIAFVIYKLYMLMKGTRGVQMLIGLLFIVVAFVVAKTLQLKGLTWIISRVAGPAWVIAFVILFQPELRRMLIRLGQNPFLRLFVKVKESRELDEVVKAVSELSKRHYGALMVLPRDTRIRGIIETGTQLQAQASSSLIVALFNPQSPMHDGAMVIEDGIIEATGCILPLTERPVIDPSLGLRHRAALGLAEETDAVVVAVSEEMGAISVAVEGKLIRGLDSGSLKRELARLFRAEKG